MNPPTEWSQQIVAFPVALRDLIDAELAAGNTIVEVNSCFPAPPAGAYVKLSGPVSTRPRASGGEIRFYDRATPSYSGEFTDERRFYFVLEPPHLPEPEPDMNAIRTEINVRQAGLSVEEFVARQKLFESREILPELLPGPKQTPPFSAAVERFRQSTVMDYEKWHDGVGYDLAMLKTVSQEDLEQIEALLVESPAKDWRDVEALAALNTPRARTRLRQALKSTNHEVIMAVHNHASEVLSDDERIRTLVTALESARIYGGLTQALLEVETFHPPEIIEALLRGLLRRDGETAVNLAAMVLYLYGKADSAFDWSQRPFFLRFNTEDRIQREEVFRELCGRVGVDGESYLSGSRGEGGSLVT